MLSLLSIDEQRLSILAVSLAFCLALTLYLFAVGSPVDAKLIELDQMFAFLIAGVNVVKGIGGLINVTKGDKVQ